VEKAVQHIPAGMVSDLEGSAAYQKFALTSLLADVITQLGSVAL
jgi:hypothetical protein